MSNTTKQFGQSILHRPAGSEITNLEDIDVFGKIDETVDAATVESMTAVKSTKEKVVLDALTGVRIGSKVEDTNYDSVSGIVNEREEKGRHISSLGKSLVAELLGSDMTDEQISRLTSVFDTIDNVDAISSVDNNTIINALGTEIMSKLQSKVLRPDMLGLAARNMFTQIYNSYVYEIQYNDDVKTLNTVMNSMQGILADLDNSTTLESIKGIEKKLSSLLGMVDNVEKADKQDARQFKITDEDVNIMADIHAILVKALNFESIKEAVVANAIKFSKDIRKKNKMRDKIETWISDLKSDANTLYTFPVEARTAIRTSNTYDEFIEFLSRTIMSYEVMNYAIPPETTDIVEYLKEKKYITDADIVRYEDMASIFIYVMSRTFKVGKLESIDKRREVSYIMDIICKATHPDHRTPVYEVVKFVYDTLKQ